MVSGVFVLVFQASVNVSVTFPFSAQLVWLVRELVKSGIMGADGVVMTLLKQIAGETLARAVVFSRVSSRV